ncbi:hypothetical protein [Yunchengibacter salinarum]|uniref:hypothetical protein n=1 Tax=Yunchengibacter salinarum TaxID=3133399 RepID=UPI0035B6301F
MSYHGLSLDKLVIWAERGHQGALAAVVALTETNPGAVDLDNNRFLMLRLVQFVMASSVAAQAGNSAG